MESRKIAIEQTVKQFIFKYCEKLNIKEHIAKVIKISIKISELGILSNISPGSFSIACIKFFVDLNKLAINDKLIADTCQFSEITIRKLGVEFSKHKNFLIGEEQENETVDIIKIEI